MRKRPACDESASHSPAQHHKRMLCDTEMGIVSPQSRYVLAVRGIRFIVTALPMLGRAVGQIGRDWSRSLAILGRCRHITVGSAIFPKQLSGGQRKNQADQIHQPDYANTQRRVAKRDATRLVA